MSDLLGDYLITELTILADNLDQPGFYREEDSARTIRDAIEEIKQLGSELDQYKAECERLRDVVAAAKDMVESDANPQDRWSALEAALEQLTEQR